MSNGLIEKGLLELELGISAHEFSPVELVDAYLEEIENKNEALNAYVTVTADRARKEAKVLTEELTRSGPRGPLHGMPFAAKDLMDTAGVRTTYGSDIFRDHVPKQDAEPIRRLREAGAILLGKTNTHEFAFGCTTNNPHFGATQNPWKHGHIPAGSSGGSAAAVAAKLAPFATGTDTGGSIRMPAAVCGCAGLKPTWGRVSLRGTFPMEPTFDHVGPIARTPRDAAIAMNVMAGFDLNDPWSPRQVAEEEFTRLLGRKMRGRKIGIDPNFRPVPLQKAVADNFQRALATFEELGCEIREVALPDAAEALETGYTLVYAGTAYSHRDVYPGNESRYGADVAPVVPSGRAIAGQAVIAAQHARARLKRAFERVVTQQVDAIVLPCVAIEAPKIGADAIEIDGSELDVTMAMLGYTLPLNVAQLPSLSVPTGFGPEGLPTALQIATAPGQDALALALGEAYRAATSSPEEAMEKPASA